VRRDIYATIEAMDDVFGMTVGVYTGKWFWQDEAHIYEDMSDRPLWVATYYTDKHPHAPVVPVSWRSRYDIHQYTSKGTVAGQYPVDLNWIPENVSMASLQVGREEDDNGEVIRRQVQVIRNSLAVIEGVL